MYVTIPAEHTEIAPIAPLTGKTVKTAEMRLKTGSYLYFEGDVVKSVYQVVSGVLRLTRLLDDGRRQVIAFGYPGDIVGFPSNGLHHTDCDALNDTQLQPYRGSVLESCECDPLLHKKLVQAVLNEVSAMQDHFMMLGQKSAAEKLASFLCVLADRVGQKVGNYKQVHLPMTRADIADFLGLTTETVSRTFTQLRKNRVIAIENIHTIILLQPETLLDLSQSDD